MRGQSERHATMMLGLTPDGSVPKNHPLRRIKPLADSALERVSPLFDQIYAAGGRPSIPPEHLLKSSFLMAFYTIRSERQFCEQLRYNLLYKWFLDLNSAPHLMRGQGAGHAGRRAGRRHARLRLGPARPGRDAP